MQDILLKIKEGVREVFPVPTQFNLVPETPLNDIPDWDSMSSVNFKIFLEEAFKMEIPDDLFDGETKIGDIADHIAKAVS